MAINGSLDDRAELWRSMGVWMIEGSYDDRALYTKLRWRLLSRQFITLRQGFGKQKNCARLLTVADQRLKGVSFRSIHGSFPRNGNSSDTEPCFYRFVRR